MSQGTAKLRSHFGYSRLKKGVLSVLSAVVLTAVFAFVAFAVDTGLIVATQTNMQNAVDAASLAASQEITNAIYEAGQGQGGAGIGSGSAAVANARLMAEQVAAYNGVYIDPNVDVVFGKRTYDEGSGTWNITWNAEPYNVVKVIARRDDPDTTQPDSEVKLAFGWAVGKPSIPLSVSASAFVEARDIAMVLDFSGSMNFDSQFRSDTIAKLGQTAVEDNLYDMWQDLGSPLYGNLPFEPGLCHRQEVAGEHQVDWDDGTSHLQDDRFLGLLVLHERWWAVFLWRQFRTDRDLSRDRFLLGKDDLNRLDLHQQLEILSLLQHQHHEGSFGVKQRPLSVSFRQLVQLHRLLPRLDRRDLLVRLADLCCRFSPQVWHEDTGRVLGQEEEEVQRDARSLEDAALSIPRRQRRCLATVRLPRRTGLRRPSGAGYLRHHVTHRDRSR